RDVEDGHELAGEDDGEQPAKTAGAQGSCGAGRGVHEGTVRAARCRVEKPADAGTGSTRTRVLNASKLPAWQSTSLPISRPSCPRAGVSSPPSCAAAAPGSPPRMRA